MCKHGRGVQRLCEIVLRIDRSATNGRDIAQQSIYGPLRRPSAADLLLQAYSFFLNSFRTGACLDVL